jgi:hypothetical protein
VQTLGLADSTPRSESRIKALLWPSIDNATDVDYLGTQGFWLCLVVAVVGFVGTVVAGSPIFGAIMFSFFFLSGVGVRERSRYAAVMVLAVYIFEILLGPGVFKIILGAVLLSNLRGTWLASTWRTESEEAVLPPRLSDTFTDKLSDQLPAWLWPKVRIPYYVFSVIIFLMSTVGFSLILIQRFELAKLPTE